MELLESLGEFGIDRKKLMEIEARSENSKEWELENIAIVKNRKLREDQGPFMFLWEKRYHDQCDDEDVGYGGRNGGGAGKVE